MNKTLLSLSSLIIFMSINAVAAKQSFYIKITNDLVDTPQFHQVNLDKEHVNELLDDGFIQCEYKNSLAYNGQVTLVEFVFSIAMGDGDYSPLGLLLNTSLRVDGEYRASSISPFRKALDIKSAPTLLLFAPLSDTLGDQRYRQFTYFGIAPTINSVDNIMAESGDEWDKRKVQEAIIFESNETQEPGKFFCKFM
ncbi:MAG: hypothetical protein HON90_02130 [Halobacteriovoraceae bacterium]|jgi:hypothetical protein|nr:hypothetical protein [Halobacteriovoraceae bacterium]